VITIAWDDTQEDNKTAVTAQKWNNMVTDQKSRAKILTPEEYTGTDLTGSSGDTNRVLTINNTETTQQIMVFVEGRAEAPSNLVITHNSSGSTVEFKNPIYADDNILIFPYA